MAMLLWRLAPISDQRQDGLLTKSISTSGRHGAVCLAAFASICPERELNHQCQHYSDCPLFCVCLTADVANSAYAVSLMMTSLPSRIHLERNLALCIPKPPPCDRLGVLAASVHDLLRPALRTCVHTHSGVVTCWPLASRGESPAGFPDHSGEGQ